MEEEKQEEKVETSKKPWLFKKGNQWGKLKGPSMKVWLRNKLSTMDEDERQEFVSDMPKEFLMRMAEGNPKESVEVEEKIDPYADVSDEQLRQELARRMGQARSEKESDIPNGGNSEVPKDGENPPGSGTVSQEDSDKQEGSDTPTEKPSEDNHGNNQLDDTAVADQSQS